MCFEIFNWNTFDLYLYLYILVFPTERVCVKYCCCCCCWVYLCGLYTISLVGWLLVVGWVVFQKFKPETILFFFLLLVFFFLEHPYTHSLESGKSLIKKQQQWDCETRTKFQFQFQFKLFSVLVIKKNNNHSLCSNFDIDIDFDFDLIFDRSFD